jgi:hypothetical protein
MEQLWQIMALVAVVYFHHHFKASWRWINQITEGHGL